VARQRKESSLGTDHAIQVVTALSALLTALTAAAAIMFTKASLDATRDQLRVNEQTHVTDRYARAIEQLASSSPVVRMGGIYALERLMRDSPSDQPTIVETLAGYVRVSTAPAEVARTPRNRSRPTPDVQGALTVLGRRHVGNDAKTAIDFRHVDVSGADLHRAQMAGAILLGAALTNADLSLSDLSNANLLGAQLEGARLNKARLVGAQLDPADLTGADLSESDLTKADLGNQGLLARGATREQIRNMPSAGLVGANLTRAILNHTNLAGVDLRRTMGITTEQLSCAILDRHTKLPPDLVRPTKRSPKCPK
jgi:hypothetical protein